MSDLPPPIPPPLPPTAPPEAPAVVAGTPWDRRAALGFLPALFDTTKQVLTEPTAFFRAMPVSGGIGAPLGYGMILGYAGLVVTALYTAILNTLVGGTLFAITHRGPFGRLLPASMSGGLNFIAQIVFGPIALVIGIFLGAGIFHLLLLIMGQARRDFEATFRVVCYAQAAGALALVPFCGQLAGGLWRIVVLIIGLSEAHKIGWGSAAIAVLAPIVLLCCCCGVGLLTFFGGLATVLHHIR